MKTKMLLMAGLMLVGSYASASTVLVENGISWTASMTGVGTKKGTITLNADTSGASFKGGKDGYLAGFLIHHIGGDPGKKFKITSLSLDDWGVNKSEYNKSGAACIKQTAGAKAGKRGCAFAESLDARLSSAAGNLAIVLGVELQSGVLLDTFSLKVGWQNENGKKLGRNISDDLTAVPLPAAAWLFGSALVGLTAVARRRNQQAPPVA